MATEGSDVRNKRSATIITGIVLAIVLVLGYLMVIDIGKPDGRPLNTLAPAGGKAQEIQNLIVPVFAIAGVAFILVEVGIIWLAARYRRRPEDVDGVGEPTQLHGNTKLENRLDPRSCAASRRTRRVQRRGILSQDDATDPIDVTVIGQQWWWEYRYDTDDDGKPDIITANELVIPAGREVALDIQSNDVIHCFWIPALNGKRDAVPGRIHPLELEADEPGIYHGQCTEFCGLSHADMRMQGRGPRRPPTSDLGRPTSIQPLTPRPRPTPPSPARSSRSSRSALRATRSTASTTDDRRSRPTVPESPTRRRPASSRQRAEPDQPDDPHHLRRRQVRPARLPRTCAAAPEASGRCTWRASRSASTGGSSSAGSATPGQEAHVRPTTRPSGKYRGMPNLNLTEDQIDQLVAYLSTPGSRRNDRTHGHHRTHRPRVALAPPATPASSSPRPLRRVPPPTADHRLAVAGSPRSTTRRSASCTASPRCSSSSSAASRRC